MPCPCKKLEEYKELEDKKCLIKLPLPMDTIVYVVASRSVCDWYTEFFIEERVVEVYEINSDFIPIPCAWNKQYIRYEPITDHCATSKYFTDRTECEKELDRIEKEYAKERW